jgi:uncharacterized membrane protein
MKTLVDTFMQCIKSESLNLPLNDEYKKEYTDEQLKKLYAISKAHDLCNVVGSAVIKNGLHKQNGQMQAKFNDAVLRSVGRYERISHELTNICKTLENAKIPFIPLKGSVLRAYYAEPWLRTSCDIDIFINLSDAEKAVKALEKDLGFKVENKWINEWSVFSPSGVHIEIHYIDNGQKTEVFVLKDVWDHATVVGGKVYQYAMSWEYFYLYHIAHMAKHFYSSGCGVRTFLDLAVMDNKLSIDKEKRDTLLKKYGLYDFAVGAEQLVDVWFNGAEHNELTQKMQAYIIKAGVYGDKENWVAVQQLKNGDGGTKHIFRRLWVPYEDLKVIYPSLDGKKWLIPFYQIRKWFRVFKPSVAKRSIKEIKVSKSVSEEKRQEISKMFSELGLNEKK